MLKKKSLTQQIQKKQTITISFYTPLNGFQREAFR